MSEQMPVAYLRADKSGTILWGEDCVCEDPVYPVSDDDIDENGELVISLPVFISAASVGQELPVDGPCGGDCEDLRGELAAARDCIATLRSEMERFGQEILAPRVFMRLVEWLQNPRPAQSAFTASIERQIAYALEMDVLPEVKRLRADAARYRWLREHGFQYADIDLGHASDDGNYVVLKPRFHVPEPAGIAYEEGEWTLSDLDAAIDAAMAGSQNEKLGAGDGQ